MMMKKIFFLISVAVLTACDTTTPMAETTTERKPYVYVPRIAVSVSCAQHQDVTYIHEFYVEEPTRRRMAGGGNCGGLIAAGYLLPEKWYPGMKVKVRWNRPIKGADSWHETTTNIMRYDEPGIIYVHFLQEIRLELFRLIPDLAVLFTAYPGMPRSLHRRINSHERAYTLGSNKYRC
jgi:hypothetical protein